MSIFALFLAYMFFSRVFGTGQTQLMITEGEIGLSNSLDVASILRGPPGDIPDLIALAYKTDNWGAVESRLTPLLRDFIGSDINWKLDIDNNTVIQTGMVFWKNRIFESATLVALPYNPDKKIAQVKLEVYRK
ncbi:hypothetical protein KY360_00500 [Candidatus Woesearchaeota archaeon]|nr:hypothetical protein [Candidatus Woesearchaeota archaeon]